MRVESLKFKVQSSIALILLLAASRGAAQQPPVEAFAGRYLELLVESAPVEATVLGIHTRDTEFPDFTPRGRARLLDKTRALQRELRRAVNPAALPPAGQVDFLLLESRLKGDIHELERVRTWRRNPVMYVAMPMEAIFIMLSRDYAPAGERAAAVLERMRKVPAVLAAGRANLRNPPRLWTEIAIEQGGEAESFFAEMTPVVENALPGRESEVRRAHHTALAAYRDFLAFLNNDLLPRSRGNFATGAALFHFYLRNNYFLDRHADALLAMGRRVFEQTEKEMEQVARRVNPAKTWPQVLDDLKKDHPASGEVLPVYRRETERARRFVREKELVTFPPGEELRVIETPMFQRSTVPYAQYFQPAPFEKSRTGFFSVTTVDPRQSPEQQEAQLRGHNYADIVDTVTHEAYPGHHLQLAIAAGAESTMRKIVSTSIFTEGWGLYAEELMAEQGYYDDSVRLLQLQWVLVRAARIILDVSLHTRSMSMDEAVDFLVKRVHLERQGATGEVRRYSLNPTQPLSYLVGRELILEMRQAERRKLGAAFSLRNFHDRLLSFGSIPPDLIRRVM